MDVSTSYFYANLTEPCCINVIINSTSRWENKLYFGLNCNSNKYCYQISRTWAEKKEENVALFSVAYVVEGDFDSNHKMRREEFKWDSTRGGYPKSTEMALRGESNHNAQ